MRTYGNWRKPKSAGLFGLSWLGTVFGFLGLLATVLVMMITGSLVYTGMGLAVLLGAVYLSTTRDKHDFSIGERVLVRVFWWGKKCFKRNLYRGGPLSRIPFGKVRLPGLLAASRLHEAYDVDGNKFAFLEINSRTFSVTLVSAPDGDALVDQVQIDSWVAKWGRWLATAADEPDLVAVTVTIESAPASAKTLRRSVEDRLVADSPSFAVSVMQDVLESYPLGAAKVSAFVALTYRFSSRVKPDVFAKNIGLSLPELCGSLVAAGAGSTRPVTASELCELVRVAYDPAASVLLEESSDPPDFDFSEVGPLASVAAWDYFAHDSGISTTWAMTLAPRGEVYSSVLAKLLKPHRDIARKRVSLMFLPIDAGLAADLVESDVNNAVFIAGGSRRAKARHAIDLGAAKASALEEASGAGLVNFGCLITATVLDEAGLAKAKTAIESLSASARLRVRPYYGAQDVAFVANLPLGVVLSDFTTFKGLS